MPGSLFYDFGDAIQSDASSAAENEANLNKVHFRVNMYKAYVKGTMKSLDDRITAEKNRGATLRCLVNDI